MKTTTITVSREILYDSDYKAVPVTIDSQKVTAEEGKKVLKAGTLLKGDGAKLLEDRTVSAVKANQNDAEGILLYDVDATDANAFGAMVYHGTVWADKVNDGQVTTVKSRLPQITFVHGK